MNLEERKAIVREYLRENPQATYKQIRKDTKIRLEREYKRGIGCMKEAYLDAGVPFSKFLRRRSRKQIIQEVIEFVKKNPNATVIEIQKQTNASVPKIFGSIKNVYEIAGLKYPRVIEPKAEKKRKILDYIKANHLATLNEISEKFNISFFKLFKNVKEMYEEAGLKPLTNIEKRRLRKQQSVINYIKSNPMAAQWEINKACKTHVQEIFKNGISYAYKLAEIPYPKERRIRYGFTDKKIKKRAYEFEKLIFKKISEYYLVKRQVKTKSGYIDLVIEIKGKKIPIEIKDYRVKNIGKNEIRQLVKYIEDLNSDTGIIICNKKIKDKVYIENKKILILTKDEIGAVAQLGRVTDSLKKKSTLQTG